MFSPIPAALTACAILEPHAKHMIGQQESCDTDKCNIKDWKDQMDGKTMRIPKAKWVIQVQE